ncbi:HYC_CC_PP family protein [Roseivirga sp.]|uniref:HYC_CC_PP family protein n=1 Tax=Roseivirga sp. TaxID=1964215 RepID=UPI002B272253|nr:hypothetical protein [Roseivirga sp.]
MARLKKTVTILFTTLYLLASTGILVGQHVCMGMIKETALFKQQEKKCNMSAEMHKSMKDCCEDEWSLTKIEDNQQASVHNEILNANYYLLYEVPYSAFLVVMAEQEEILEVKNTGPPDIPKPDLYITYHSLKIPAAIQS